MALRKKMMLTLAVPTLLFIMLGAGAILSLRHLAKTADTILADNYRTIREARTMQATLLGLGILDSGRSSDRKERMMSAAVRFEMSLAACEKNITESEERGILSSLRKEWDLLRKEINVSGQGNSVPTWNDASITLLSSHVGRLIEVNEHAMYGHRQKTRDMARLMTWLLCLILFVSVVSLITFSSAAAKRISAPISEIANNLNRILTSGKMREEIVGNGGGEIERLEVEVESLLTRLNRHDEDHHTRLSALRQRLMAVMEEMSDGIVLVDRDLAFQACNRVGVRILGIPADEESNISLDQVLKDVALRDAFQSFLDGHTETPRDLPEVTLKIEDERRVYRPHVTPILSNKDEPDGYLIVFWDATEHVEMEESRRRFIAMLSHQLKTPLTSLTMSVNLLNEHFRGKDIQSDELLNMAKEDCRSFFGLVNEVIEAARDVSSGMRLHFHRADLTQLLRAGLKPIIAQAAKKQIEFRDQMGISPIFASIDPVKFPWVVTNIAGNALRYTEAGGMVTVELLSADGMVTLVIQDTGSGISPDDLNKLFAPYVTLGKSRDSQSHGLGLAIAKEIVEAHKGSVDVESEVGSGTVFTIRIPVEDSFKI